jgi:hypothetical protein
MSIATPHPTHAFGAIQTWLIRGAALLGALLMLFYGALAIDAGIVNYRAAGNPEVVAQRQAMQARAEAGQPLGTPAEVASHSGAALALIAEASSPGYAFGERGLSETLIHYATMPRFNGITLSVHNVLGGITMLFGAMQFWPAFRRRFPLWHRAFGAIYIVAAQGAMIAAMIFLVRTPVHLIYDQLTFYIGLWGLAIGVTASLWMAIYSMKRKRIAQHQGWMALNYGMLLTAPIQRYGWAAFGAADPTLRQLEGNYAVTAVLVPLCVMIGYGLFTLNRWLQTDRTASAQARVAEPFAGHARLGRTLAWLMLPLLALAAWATVDTLLLNPGLARLPGASTLIPAGVIALDQAVIVADTGSRLAFAAATLLGLAALAAWLRGTTLSEGRTPPEVAGWLLVAASAVLGVLLVQWGLQLGMPGFETLHGGALHVFGGGMTLLFAALMAGALSRQAWGWAREWSWFLLACLLATPSLSWALPAIGSLGLPSEYVQTGHAWRLAAYGQWFPLIGAFLCAIHSEATHAKLAR